MCVGSYLFFLKKAVFLMSPLTVPRLLAFNWAFTSLQKALCSVHCRDIFKSVKW